MDRTTWTDERIDDAVGRIDGRFDRVEADIRELRSLNWWLWASTMLAVLGVLVTVLLRT
jgi:hypothetical protein